MLTRLTIVTALAWAASVAAADAPAGGGLPEWRGAYGGPPAATTILARDEAEWRRVQQVFGLRGPLPAVDFSRHMVAGVGLGSRPTGGYRVTIVGAEERDGVVYVRYQERRPRPDEFVTQAFTSPYHVRVLPRLEAPRIVFEREDAPGAGR